MKDNNSLIPSSGQNLPSFEEFKDMVLNYNEKENIIDKVADKYDQIPTIFKVFKNFDPTGIASSIDDILSENKAKREQNNILLASYYMFQSINNLQAEIEKDKQQFSNLTEIYFQKSKESYQEDKIKYYRNIWFNGIINTERTFNEKEYVFELISTLSFDQIRVLKYLSEKLQANMDNSLKSKGSYTHAPIFINEFAQTAGLEVSYVQQICINLEGKGLLHTGLAPISNAGPQRFLTTDFAGVVIKYLNEPDI